MELPVAKDAKNARPELFTPVPQDSCLLHRAWLSQQPLCSWVFAEETSPSAQLGGEMSDSQTREHLPSQNYHLSQLLVIPSTLLALSSLYVCSLWFWGCPSPFSA